MIIGKAIYAGGAGGGKTYSVTPKSETWQHNTWVTLTVDIDAYGNLSIRQSSGQGSTQNLRICYPQGSATTITKIPNIPQAAGTYELPITATWDGDSNNHTLTYTVVESGGGGGMKPEVIVTAEAGSTLTCGTQSYTLGASETTHTFTVALGTYIVTATKGSDSATETVLVDMVAQYAVELEYAIDVAVTITGSGDVNRCYATVGGTKRYGAGTYTVQTGDTITFHVGGNAGHIGTVKIDGTEVLRNGSINGADYDWAVPRNTSTIQISIAYSRSYYQGTITVTTS